MNINGGSSSVSYIAFSVMVVTKSNANIELIQLSQTFSTPSSSITLPSSSKFGFLSPVNRVVFIQWMTAFDSANIQQAYGFDSTLSVTFSGLSVKLNNTLWMSGIKLNILITTR